MLPTRHCFACLPRSGTGSGTLLWAGSLLCSQRQSQKKGGAVTFTKADMKQRADPDYRWDNFTQSWPVKKRSAFHLPGVCRQIYSETALLLYSHNTFVFLHEHFDNHSPFMDLLAAQREAVTAVELSPIALMVHFACGNSRPLRQMHLPNLKRLHVSKDAVQHVDAIVSNHRGSPFTQECKPWIETRLRFFEGEDLHVVFEE